MSEIQDYFENSTIFITGGTGYLGCLLVEKLLRTCNNLKRIYLLIRPKKNVSESERFEKLFDTPVFDKLKVENPECLKKVLLMSGDITAPKLGLSEKNIDILNSEVNCIYHSAANVHFLEKLRTSYDANVRPVQEIIKIAKNISNLTSMVYVSTAYTNLKSLKAFDETFHDGVAYTSQQLESLLHNFDDDFIESIKQEIIKDCSNVYLFNKSIAEEVIRRDGHGLPIAIVKPSMITPTISDPFPGWIDNYYGIIALFLISVTGFFRTILLESNCKADFVPADYVVNLLIAAAWDISNKQKHRVIESKVEEQSTISIYNCVNASQNPITFGKSLSLMRKHYYDPLSSDKIMAKNILYTTTNSYVYFVLRYAAVLFPAYVQDLCRSRNSKSNGSFKICEKQYEFLDTVQLALLREWNFSDKNAQNLWKSLSMKDRAIYHFNISDIDWNIYCKITVNGIRTHLLKHKMKTSNSKVAIKSRL